MNRPAPVPLGRPLRVRSMDKVKEGERKPQSYLTEEEKRKALANDVLCGMQEIIIKLHREIYVNRGVVHGKISIFNNNRSLIYTGSLDNNNEMFFNADCNCRSKE